MNDTWNPRYTLYAAALGFDDPAAASAFEAQRWPGGKMTGFILWMSARWDEWRSANALKRDSVLSEDDFRAFDAWLAEYVAKSTACIRADHCVLQRGHDGDCSSTFKEN